MEDLVRMVVGARRFWLLALAILCLGLSHIALLPPWEGFDEHAHYGYVQYLADEKKLPVMGAFPFSTDLADYQRVGPMPYSLALTDSGRKSYRDLAISSENDKALVRRLITGRPGTPRQYEPTPGKNNWQAQHPPLYYIILTPFYDLSRNWAWRDHLFLLRSISLVLAMAAIFVGVAAIGVLKTANMVTEGQSTVMTSAILLWPLFIPMWVPEMARLGNDSLCALWVALSWFFLCKIAVGQRGVSSFVGLGIGLGLGALTKAFFLPIGLGAGIFILACIIRTRRSGQPITPVLLGGAVTLFLVLVIAGWWYGRMFWSANDVVGGTFAQAQEQGVHFSHFIENFDLWLWLYGTGGIATTFAWSGTWSFTRPPGPTHWILVLLPAMMSLLYARAVLLGRMQFFAWIPVLIVLPFIAGLLYHGLTWIALHGGQPYTNGWYLHIFYVPTATMFGLIAHKHWRIAAMRWFIYAMALYAGGFHVVTSALQAALYAGAAVPDVKNRFVFPDGLSDFGLRLPTIWNDLEALAYPWLALCFIGGAAVILVFALSRGRLYSAATDD